MKCEFCDGFNILTLFNKYVEKKDQAVFITGQEYSFSIFPNKDKKTLYISIIENGYEIQVYHLVNDFEKYSKYMVCERNENHLIVDKDKLFYLNTYVFLHGFDKIFLINEETNG